MRRDEDGLGIGEAARMVGVAVETFRRWSDAGRIPSYRTPGGQRRFRRADVETLREQVDHPASSSAEGPDADPVVPPPRAALRPHPAGSRGAA